MLVSFPLPVMHFFTDILHGGKVCVTVNDNSNVAQYLSSYAPYINSFMLLVIPAADTLPLPPLPFPPHGGLWALRPP